MTKSNARTNRKRLQVETLRKGGYFVVRVLDDDPGERGDLTELLSIVRRAINGGDENVAVVFTRSAYLYTRSIAALIRCYAMIDDAGGVFAVVAPNPHLMHAIELAGIHTVVKTFTSEEQLTRP